MTRSILPGTGIRVWQLIRPDGTVAWSVAGPKSHADRLRKFLQDHKVGYTLREYTGKESK